MNLDNPSTHQNRTDGNTKPLDGTFRTAAIILSAATAVIAFQIFLTMQRAGAWQMYAVSGVLGMFWLVNAAALVIIRRGKPETGSWMIIIGMFIVFPISVVFISNVGLLFGITLALLTFIVANQTLPSKSAWRAFFISIPISILTASLDLLNLEYRLFNPEIQTFVPAITGVILLAVIFFLIRESIALAKSLRLKISLWTGSIITGTLVVLVIYSTITGRQLAIDAAQKEALAIAASEANLARIEAEIPLNTARTVAQALTTLKDPANNTTLSRDQVNAMLRQVLIENPTFLGTYTLWEPNAFDGLDASFENMAAHDATGRFIPYWVRGDDGTVSVIALIDYETPGIGDWYIQPRQTKTEVTIAPLIYPINGVDTLMASFVVPIIYNDKFYGITGVDAPISFAQTIVDEIDIYNGTAEAVLMTAQGTLISVSNKPELANQPATQIFPDFSDLQARIEAGESFISPSLDGQYLRVFAPVDLGRTGKHWSFSLIIPITEITASATRSAILEGMIGLTLIVLALVILWFLSGQIVRPILNLTMAANEVTKGNLNTKAEVQAMDETGLLANAFNLMITQLRESFETLEDRVAERTQSLELASEVGRSVSQVRALDVMLTDAAELIRSKFGLYYVQVYLTNPSQTYLNLQAGTGRVGEELLARNHRLPLNTNSINGRAAVEKKSVVISDTSANATFKPNPLLPDTHSEMAVPLMIGERVVGVLDMQSEHAGSLNTDTLAAFEALAGQLAIAIQNTTFLAQTEQARAQVEAQARRQSRSNWNDYLDAIHKPEETGFVFEKNQIAPMSSEEQSHPQINEHTLSAPIEVIGESLGSLIVEMEGQSPISRTEELINTVARQVAQQIESLRLLDSAERYRAEAEESSRRITREGWKSYKENTDQSISFFYDLKEVQPYNDESKQTEGLTVPLKFRDETIGKMVVQGLDAGDSEGMSLANAVAERLGTHLESLRQFAETQRGQIELDKRAQQLAAVAEISTASSKELDTERMLQSVVTLTQRKFGLYHAHIFTFNESTASLEIQACGWQEGDEHEGTHGTTTIPVAQEQSLVARAARTRQAVIVNNVHNEAGWLPNPLLPNTASEMAVPMIVGDQVLGVLDVQSDQLNAFTDEDANIQTTLASQVATALQNARTFSQAQQQAERESTLNAISQKIQSATTVEAVLQIAARELGHALGAPMTIAQLSMKDKK